MFKKLVKGFGLAVAIIAIGVMSVLVLSGWTLPTDSNGRAVTNLDFVGCSATSIAASTTPTLVRTGATLVYAVFLDSDATDVYVVLRDSATANITSTAKVANIKGVTGGRYLTFSAPINFTNGVSMNNSSDTCNSTILWRAK